MSDTPDTADRKGSTPWLPVESSNVAAIRRVGGSLHVKFLSGAVYSYYDAGDRLKEMADSPSKGQYVWRVLRKGYPYSRLS